MPPRSLTACSFLPPEGPLRLRSGEASPAAPAGLFGEDLLSGAGLFVGECLLGGEGVYD